jgi:hypothetical protein
MANKIVGQRLVDSTKRNLTKVILMSDGTQEANTRLIDVSTLSFALNTSGRIMTANVNPKTAYRTTIRRVFGNMKANSAAAIRLQWEGTGNSEIVTSGAGSFDYNFENMGDGAVLFNPESGAVSGDILISTSNLGAGDAITLFIDLRKDNQDYDAGQTADPYAFNRG